MLTLKNFLRCGLEKQRVVLFYYLPVALASGIGCYLSLRQEPAPNLLVAMALLGGVFSGLSFSNMQLSAVSSFVCGVLPWVFCGGRKGLLYRGTHAYLPILWRD